MTLLLLRAVGAPLLAVGIASQSSVFDGVWVSDKERNSSAVERGLLSGDEVLRLMVADEVLTVWDRPTVETKYPLDGSPVKHRIGAREVTSRAKRDGDRIVVKTETAQGLRTDVYSIEGIRLRVDSTFPGPGEQKSISAFYVRRPGS